MNNYFSLLIRIFMTGLLLTWGMGTWRAYVSSVAVLSYSLQSHGLQPTRLLCSWDFLGKNTAVGCHFYSRGSSRSRDRIHVSCVSYISCIVSRFFTTTVTWEALPINLKEILVSLESFAKFKVYMHFLCRYFWHLKVTLNKSVGTTCSSNLLGHYAMFYSFLPL